MTAIRILIVEERSLILVNRATITSGPPFARSKLQPLTGNARRKNTSSPITRTDSEPPSVSITLVYESGARVVVVVDVVAGAVVVVDVVAGAVVVVVVGAARGTVVVGVGFAGPGGWVVVGVALGRGVGVGAVVTVEPPWGNDLAASSCRAWTSAPTADLVMGGSVVVVVFTVLVGAPRVVVVPVTRTGVGSSSSRPGPSSEASESSSDVETARSGDAEIPSAVGASVTSLRTLPTAAAAIVTATTVATNQAIPMPPNLLIPVVWYRFPDTATGSGQLSILLACMYW